MCLQSIQVCPKTWLENSKLGYDKVLMFTCYWSQKLKRIKFCERELELTHGTAVKIGITTRGRIAAKLLAPIELYRRLTVEIEESLFVLSKHKVNRVQNDNGYSDVYLPGNKGVLLYAVDYRSNKLLNANYYWKYCPRFNNHIGPMESVQCIRNANQGFYHNTVNRSEHVINPLSGTDTNAVERMWGWVKSSFKRRHGNHFFVHDEYWTVWLMINSYICASSCREVTSVGILSGIFWWVWNVTDLPRNSRHETSIDWATGYG